MDDDKKTLDAGADPAQNSGSGSATEGGTQSFDDILSSNKEFQSEFDRRVNQAISTAKTKWEQNIEDEKDEAKKLEKMTQAQRDKYLFEKEKEAFAKQKKSFELEQMKVSTANELIKRGLDPSFSSFLSSDTAEKTKENIDAFENAFNSAVQTATNDRMRGDPPPKDVKKDKKSGSDDPFLKGFES